MYVRYGDQDALNFVVAFIKDGKPRTSIEAVILAQAAVTNGLVMENSRKISNAEDPVERESYARLHSLAARTFANQNKETLRRQRTGGERRVVVQHVSVNEGGQAAVVGQVTQQARQNAAGKSKAAPQLQATRALNRCRLSSRWSQTRSRCAKKVWHEDEMTLAARRNIGTDAVERPLRGENQIWGFLQGASCGG